MMAYEAELTKLQNDYVQNGFCYVRNAVKESDVDELVKELWRQAEVRKVTLHPRVPRLI